jgi:hypothetical protein
MASWRRATSVPFLCYRIWFSHRRTILANETPFIKLLIYAWILGLQTHCGALERALLLTQASLSNRQICQRASIVGI